MIMVHTAVRHRRSRDLIRETWGASVLPQKPTRLLFAIGDPLLQNHDEFDDQNYHIDDDDHDIIL